MRHFIRLLLITTMLLSAAAHAQDTAPARHTVKITARVPEGTGTVYLPGNLEELGPWDPAKFAMNGTGTERTATLEVPAGTLLEFKFTLGTWDSEAVGPSGTVMPNYRLLVEGDLEEAYDLAGFRRPPAEYMDDWQGSGVQGRLVYWFDVSSKYLENNRHVVIWLPPGYEDAGTRRYPVIYMHDGQNLFDPRMSATGVDWGVDEAIVRGVETGTIQPAIVVGIFNTDQRLREYSPWDKGPDYARFLIEELIPRINQEFRTLSGPDNTSTMGSSMGGLVSFWLVWKHSEVFGSAGCLSTHWPWNGRLDHSDQVPPLILGELQSSRDFPRNARVYFDFGTGPGDDRYEPFQDQVTAWLKERGLEEGKDFDVRKFEGAPHNEAAWRERLDEPIEFLLRQDKTGE